MYCKLSFCLPALASQKRLHKGTKGAVAWGKVGLISKSHFEISGQRWNYCCACTLAREVNWGQFADINSQLVQVSGSDASSWQSINCAIQWTLWDTLGHIGSCGHLNPLLLPSQMGRWSQCCGHEAIYYSRQEACRHFADRSGIFLSHMSLINTFNQPTNKCIFPPSKLNNLATYRETEKPSLKEDCDSLCWWLVMLSGVVWCIIDGMCLCLVSTCTRDAGLDWVGGLGFQKWSDRRHSSLVFVSDVCSGDFCWTTRMD